jgi:hypothetical protein
VTALRNATLFLWGGLVLGQKLPLLKGNKKRNYTSIIKCKRKEVIKNNGKKRG